MGRALLVVWGAMLLVGAVLGGCALAPRETDAGPDAVAGDAGAGDGEVVVALDGFDRRCRTDDDCLYVLGGDVCGCACEGTAIAQSARRDYLAALDAAQASCGERPDCAACPDAFVWCEAGMCRARNGRGACGCGAGQICVQRFDGGCGGGALSCVTGPAECGADPREPIARRVCEPGCAVVVCGDGIGLCGGGGGTCGDRAPTPEHPAAMQCHAP